MNSAQRTKPKPRPWQQGDDEPVSFGSWLRRQREMRQIELAEIASVTKISRRYLDAFEQDEFDCLPAPIFAQGFLREYAKFIGVDPDEAVTLYQSALQALEPEEDEATGKGAVGNRGPGKNSGWLYSLLVVLAVAIALLAVYIFSFRAASRQRDNPSRSPVDSAPPIAVAQPLASEPAAAMLVQPVDEMASAEGASTAVAPRLRGAPVESAASGDVSRMPIRVTLDFTRNCWVEIRVDSKRRIEELRVEGESVQVAAERLVEMKLGDAGAVDVYVNGSPYSLGRGSGQVARATIDLETVEALTGPS